MRLGGLWLHCEQSTQSEISALGSRQKGLRSLKSAEGKQRSIVSVVTLHHLTWGHRQAVCQAGGKGWLLEVTLLVPSAVMGAQMRVEVEANKLRAWAGKGGLIAPVSQAEDFMLNQKQM